MSGDCERRGGAATDHCATYQTQHGNFLLVSQSLGLAEITFCNNTLQIILKQQDIFIMESDELFDYISDLPNDNVLEICNFVLIGGGDSTADTGDTGADHDHGASDMMRDSVTGADTDQDNTNNSTNSDNYNMTNFSNNYEIMEYHTENNNNHVNHDKNKVKIYNPSKNFHSCLQCLQNLIVLASL